MRVGKPRRGFRAAYPINSEIPAALSAKPPYLTEDVGSGLNFDTPKP